MSELQEIQAWMAELLRARRALPSSPEATRQAERYLAGNDRLSPVEQLEIYREQFWLRHTGSLLEDFPGLAGILGQNDWERLVEGYLSSRTPTSWTLRDLGSGLPGFIETEADWLAHRRLCLDMARLEWAYIELFDAPDVPLLDAARLATVPDDAWERVRLTLSPSLRLLEVGYPVASLRRELRDGTAPSVAIPAPSPQWLVLYRGRNRRLFHKPISRGAFTLLQALSDGAALGAAAEGATARCPDEAQVIADHIGEWFADWGRRGWVVDVHLPSA